MKNFIKKLTFVLSVVILLSCAGIGMNVSMAYETEDGFVYDEYTSSVGITGYTGNSTNLVIPAKIAGKPVASIGRRAFADMLFIESVEIPVAVSSIYDCAFEGCDNIKSFTVDGRNSSYLSKDGVLYSKDMTVLCRYPSGMQTEHFIVPETVTTLGMYAFQGADLLGKITLNEGLEIIDSAAFERCASIEEITVPEGVTYIGSSAFEACDKLKSVNLPESVTYIGAYGFAECTALEEIKLPYGVDTIYGATFQRCTGLKNVEISPATIQIDYMAFAYCSSLESVTVSSSEGVTEMPEEGIIISYAFYECTSLNSIEIPEAITVIEHYAFCGCESLSEITLPQKLKSIGDGAFKYCSSLTEVVIPDGISVIEWETFGTCTGLQQVTIPFGVKKICMDAFDWCFALTDVYYEGSEKSWNLIEIDEENEQLFKANIHFAEYTPGDVTDDGKINMADVVSIRRFLVNADEYRINSEMTGDVTGDGKINMADVVAIRRYLVNASEYPI